MLYVTTRSDSDAFTAQRVLCEKRSGDGGLYVPFRSPLYSPEDIDSIARKRFSAAVAELINLQFNTRLTSREVDLALGRYPVRLEKLSHRILVAECWHNTRGCLDRMAENLASLINTDSGREVKGDWLSIAVRIAILFGIYGELNRAGMADRENPFDISVVSGDFTGAISAWYARSWGLPIGSIVVCCNENNGLWNLLSLGQLRTDGVPISTRTSLADVTVPENLERLIHAVAGAGEAAHWFACVKNGATYYLPATFLPNLRNGLQISVVSQVRMFSTISNCFATLGYLMSPYDALCHSGLLDYRSRTGSSGTAVILSERSAELDLETVAQALDKEPEQVKQYLDKR